MKNQENQKLIEACKNGDLEKVKYFVSIDYNINFQDVHNNTPLLHSVVNENLNIVEFLVKNGANINAKNRYNNDSIILASDHNSLDILEFLFNNNKNKNYNYDRALYAGVYAGHLNIIKFLITNINNININFTDEDNFSLLKIAYKHGHLNIVKFLILNGADYSFLNKKELNLLLPIIRLRKINKLNERSKTIK